MFSSKWRRSFAVVFEKCQHQDSFLGIYTSKGSATAKDLIFELYPTEGNGKTFNIHCHGYDKGALERKVSDIGFEIDVTSEFSTPLAELKELGVRTLELSCRSIVKEDEPMG